MNKTVANKKDQSIVPAVQFKEFLPFGHQGDGVSTIAQEPVGVAASSNGTVDIYIRQLSSFRAPTLWFIDLTVATCHIQSTFLSLCQFIFTRKQRKHENT